jgi:hypothetical protein
MANKIGIVTRMPTMLKPAQMRAGVSSMTNEDTGVAVVDAVTENLGSGVEFKVTIRLSARGTALRGAYVNIVSDGDQILGRFRDVTMINPVHDNEAMAPLIMRAGQIRNWSGDVDIERGVVEIMATIDENGQRIPLRRNPKSGTAVRLADQAAIDRFATEQEHFLVLGHIPNSGGLFASVINRHFGPRVDDQNRDAGGYNEARHIAILGQSGSAKSVLATTLIAGRLAAHSQQMGLLMPDTSGDLCDPTRHNSGDYRWNYAEVLRAKGIAIEIIPISDVRLTSPYTLSYKMRDFLRGQLSTTTEKAATLADRVVEELFEGGEVDVGKLTSDNVIAAMVEHIPFCWTKKEAETKVETARTLPRRYFGDQLDRVKKLFDGKWRMQDLISDVLLNHRKIAISGFGSMIEADHKFVMREIMDNLTRKAQGLYFTNRTANAMVVLDEAQRWVPEGDHDDEGMAETIEDGFRTTRKYGLGWMVVAQSPAGISKRVLRQCHTTFCGRNLGLGADSQHLKDVLGDAGAKAYAQLAQQGGYYWVAKGLDANLGGETWFAIHPFSGDATNAFIKANPHIFGGIRHVGTAAE